MQTALACAGLGVWLYLALGHGGFWRSTPALQPLAPNSFPEVDIIVPARDEAPTIKAVVDSLVSQDYGGAFSVIVVDDNSSDGTAQAAGTAARLQIIRLEAKPAGWSGKLWAVAQGVAAGRAEVLLLTDADIVHDPRHVSTLVAKLLGSHVDMVSEMVKLNCTSVAEKALVPAFVYFFQMLYPFARVNDPASSVAAAAGGTVLIRREALARIGGIDAIKGALIDDVSLAKAVKQAGRIYLGHSELAASIRPYCKFADIWVMVSRTAFTQLRHSPALLLLTLIGLTFVWLLPVGEALFGHGPARLIGLTTFLLSAATYLPTLARYERSPLWSLALPLIALFYMAATVGSAVYHWRGQGGRWKNRTYQA